MAGRVEIKEFVKRELERQPAQPEIESSMFA
jgi:hypothetical protein